MTRSFRNNFVNDDPSYASRRARGERKRARRVAGKLLQWVEKQDDLELNSLDEVLAAIERARTYFGNMSDEEFDSIFNEEFAHSFTRPTLMITLDEMRRDALAAKEFDRRRHDLSNMIVKKTGVKLPLLWRMMFGRIN